MNIKAALIELAKLNNTLTKKGGPEKNGHLFEKVMNLEDEILNITLHHLRVWKKIEIKI